MRIRTSTGPVTAAVVLAASLAGAGWAAPAFAEFDPIPAKPVVTGVEKVAVTTTFGSSDRTRTVPCPAGKVALGGGGYLTSPSDAAGRVAMDRSAPSTDGTSWTVSMREVGAVKYTGDWRFTYFAFCADRPSGYQVVSEVKTGWNDHHRLSKTAACPGTTKVLGSGAEVYNSNSAFVLDRVSLGDALWPNGGTNYTWAVARTVDQGTVAHGTEALRTFAICANEPAGYEVVRAASEMTSGSLRNVAGSCTLGKLLSVGAGIEVSSIHEDDRTQTLLTGLNGTAGTANAWAHEDADGYAEAWGLSLALVCAS
ncbi:hypothetical protein AB0L34_19760 [Micromonospora sp. NPDC052213]|uniref:hypothetical protein n=1 Tax=Micromonospora sp. NPDC052213 TaxID=3155812 RepID=UPI003426B7BD